MRAKVQAALDEIRPFIHADGGDVELLSVADGVVRVRLSGQCIGCPSLEVTLKKGIEGTIRKHLPEIERVEHVMPGTPLGTLEPVEAKHEPTPAPQSSPFEDRQPGAQPTEKTSTDTKDLVTYFLRKDHSKAKVLLNNLDAALVSIASGQNNETVMETLDDLVTFLKVDLTAHMRMEDEVLFPALLPIISWGAPMSAMAHEHEDLQKEIDLFYKAVEKYKETGDHKDLLSQGQEISQHLRDDFFQEETVLFPQADGGLTGARAKALQEAMLRIKRQVERANANMTNNATSPTNA